MKKIIHKKLQNNKKLKTNKKREKKIKIEKEIKILYSDFKQNLLDREDYKKFYKEKSNEKNKIRKELEIISQEEKSKHILKTAELNDLINKILNIFPVNKNIISELIYDIQIDKENKIYINYRYDIWNM